MTAEPAGLKPLFVALVNYNHYARFKTVESLLEHYYNLWGWGEGLTEAGAQVRVFQRYYCDRRLRHGNLDVVLFHEYGPRLRGWQIPRRFHRTIAASCKTASDAGSDVLVHLGGMVFPMQTRSLRRMLPKSCALVAQHHGEEPWTGIRGLLQRRAMRGVDGFLFTTEAHAEPWLDRGVIASPNLVHTVMEGSSAFVAGPKTQARGTTDIQGDPAVLWTANLDANKDPLTLLDGFEKVLPSFPRARLSMAFRRDDLLKEVAQRLAQSPALEGAVTLLGRIPRNRMAAYYQSADLFVQGSHREAAGLSMLDAMACGAVPVVTDIPSFRVMTHHGRLGALWKAGDATDFERAFRQVMRQPLELQRQAAIDYFEEHWSFAAIGRKAVGIYREVLERSAKKRHNKSG